MAREKRKKYQKATIWLMAVTVGIWIAWDVFVAIWGTRATESEITMAVAYRHWILPYLVGVLCGHFFWPYTGKLAGRIWRLAGLATSSTAILVLDILGHTPEILPIYIFAPSIVIGRLLFPMPDTVLRKTL